MGAWGSRRAQAAVAPRWKRGQGKSPLPRSAEPITIYWDNRWLQNCYDGKQGGPDGRYPGRLGAVGARDGWCRGLPAVSAPPIKDARQPFYSAGETGCGFLEVRPTSGDKHRAPRFRARFAILARASAVADATAIERTVTVNAVTVDATSRVCCEFGRYLHETASCAGPISTCLGNAEVSTSAATLICGNGGSFAR
jgi:hypothetical protein